MYSEFGGLACLSPIDLDFVNADIYTLEVRTTISTHVKCPHDLLWNIWITVNLYTTRILIIKTYRPNVCSVDHKISYSKESHIYVSYHPFLDCDFPCAFPARTHYSTLRENNLAGVGREVATTDIVCYIIIITWWRHQMEIFFALMVLCRRWISRTKASDAELWCFLLSAPEWTVR